ncbi:hypothetical protein KIN20_013467 [Parelaphostrongylus tenuis]|uniref:Saposin B-type domain-containing protein n=1 Tax=Parelaphostrongylus tenuis TaxID=148309 RepID=A0AAD5MW70_PARTN|nr:hypothetical protein KIN20_013467 [Parelaphostrongylus tenuis]
MRSIFGLAVVIGVLSMINAEVGEKMFCSVCEDIVEYGDYMLKKGEAMEEKLYEYCLNKCPAKESCKKFHERMQEIIKKLEDHASPKEICTKLHLCDD